MSSYKQALVLTAIVALSPLVASAAKPGAPVDGSDLDTMDLMLHEQEQRLSSRDDRICEQVASSKQFQSWIQNFHKGDLKAAEKDWAEVLALLKKSGCDNCSHLNRVANERTLMLESKSRPKPIWQHLLEATEHAVGPNDLYTAICLKFIAMQSEGAGDYVKAQAYRKRQVEILQLVKGKKSAEAIDAANWLRKDSLMLARKKSADRQATIDRRHTTRSPWRKTGSCWHPEPVVTVGKLLNFVVHPLAGD